MKISALSEHQCHLGEGPLWDPAEQALYWVDSYAPRLYRHDFATGDAEIWDLPGRAVGSLAIRERGGLLLAMDQGLYFFDPHSGAIDSIAQPLAGCEHLRLNDGKVDPFGAFVTGALNIDYHQQENCSMYRLSPELEVSTILDGFDCFNGPCFSADGERLYVTGRVDDVIEVFDYGSLQTPRNGRHFIDRCNPDGATVDAEGYLWSAQWDDARLIRITPDGSIDTQLDFPGQIVSSVMFGGANLDLIFVTTVGGEVHGVAASGEKPGRVLVVTGSGYRGREEPMFKG